MTLLDRLKRDAGLVLVKGMSAVFVAPLLAGSAWNSFQIHPALSIVLGIAAVAVAFFALAELRECGRLFHLIDAEELRPIHYPVFPARRLAPRADITSPLPRAAAGRSHP